MALAKDNNNLLLLCLILGLKTSSQLSRCFVKATGLKKQWCEGENLQAKKKVETNQEKKENH